MSHPVLFKWKHFQPEIILLNVRWYCRYALSYRDLEERMAERGLSVDRTPIFRWVQQYGPELDSGNAAGGDRTATHPVSQQSG